jgi:hypothetical protein
MNKAERDNWHKKRETARICREPLALSSSKKIEELLEENALRLQRV